MRRRFLKYALFTPPLLLVACGERGGSRLPPSPAKGESTAPGQSLQQVTVGYVNVLPWSPIFVGVEKGYFREQGLEIKLQQLSGGAEITTQTAAGNFNVGTGGSSALFNAIGRSKGLGQKPPLTIVSPLHLEKPPLATPLVVSRKAYDEGRITKVIDLKGKRVAINAPGTATEYWLELALRKGGLSVKDVEVTGIPFPNIGQALDANQIAAAALTEPFATLATRQGQIRVLDNAFLDGEIGTLLFYNADWATKNPQPAQGFMNGFLKAVRDLESGGWSDAATLAILSKYTDVPVDVIREAPRPYGEPDGKVNLTLLGNQQTFFKAQDRLTYDQPLDLTQYVDTRYAQEVVKALGPFSRR